MEFRGWSRRQRGGCSEETMVRDICHAWLHSPSPTMGPGGGGREWGGWPVVAFFSVPSFPGTLLSLTMGLLCPRCFFFFFLPTFNPSSLLLFLPLVSVPPQTPLRENKNKKKTQLKLRLFIPLPSTPVSPPPSGPQDPIWRPGRFSRVAHLAPKNSPPF